MTKNRSLTDAAVRRMKPPASGQVDHFDKTYPGLALRVSYGGRRTWVYFYRIGGKLRRMKLDNYPPMTVAEAHEAWRTARDSVRGGRNAARKEATPSATNFRGVYEEWILRDQAGNKSKLLVQHKLEKDVLPLWEHRQIADIGRRDVLDVIDRITDRGAVIQARRVHAYLHRLFRWAVGRGIVDHNPLASLPKPGNETRRDRVLTDDEFIAVWNAAEEIGHPYAGAIKLLILTGARREEIGRLKWSEIDGNSIILDGSRTKNGKPHIIPLSAPARSIIEGLPRIANGDFVFTNDGIRAIADWGRTKTRLDVPNAAPWVIHDLRRTTATGLQKLGTPLQVTEAILGHTGGSRAGVAGIYQRHDYANEKRAALEAWGQHVMALVEQKQ